MNRTFALALLSAVLLAACASEEHESQMGMEVQSTSNTPGVSAEVIAERDALQRSLGERHRDIAKQAGDWTVTSKYGEAFGGAETVTQARSEMILDGRFLKTTMTEDMMGTPMESLSFRGYDSLTLEHLYISLNNLYTGNYEMRGREIGDGQIEYFGVMRDSMSPEGRRYRAIEKKIDDDTYEVIVYDGQGDQEFHVFTMTWKRN